MAAPPITDEVAGAANCEEIATDRDVEVNNQINWHNVMERAGALGWSVEQLNKATLPEFIHFFRGWQRSKGIDPDAIVPPISKPMTRQEACELFEHYG